jgi:hypothetical protein
MNPLIQTNTKASNGQQDRNNPEGQLPPYSGQGQLY